MRLATALIVALAARGQADVLRYTTTTTEDGEVILTSVTVSRGGRAAIFDPQRLIRVQVIHFRSRGGPNVVTEAGVGAPSAGNRAALLSDLKLNTGLINPGGQEKPLTSNPVLSGPKATQGIAVRFGRPVVNLPGDDVVVFELHRRFASPAGGDAFHIGPLRFAPGLRTLTVKAFDVDLDHPKVQPLVGFDSYRLTPAPQSLADLERAAATRASRAEPDDFHALAVGIDLSDLGYPAGARVDGLFLQDCPGTGLVVDPVLIAGLPAPEPPNVLAKEPPVVRPKPPHQMTLAEFLDGPLAGIDEIVFAARVGGWDHWYANFGHYSSPQSEYPNQRGYRPCPPLFRDGGRLCCLNIRTGKVRVLLDDPKGGIRDPQVHYDGGKILFAYRKGGEDAYHLYEINTDPSATLRAGGSGLKQLTDGPWDDIEPTYLPDGDIIFGSSRCKRFVNCYRTPVATLYRCDGDGSNVRMLSTNVEHDNTAWPLHDGRIVYMRWEYVDRSQLDFHHLWTMSPDGTGQMVFYGNERPGYAMLDARPIPGSNRVVASFSPGHGRPEHMGYITVIDPSTGPDNAPGARRLSRTLFRDPYPISDACFLVADNRGIHLMDGGGHTQMLHPRPAGGKLTFHEPRPLRPRPREPVIAPRVALREETGRLILADVTTGRNMAGVRRGEVKKLLILEQLPKPINFSGGPWPLSNGGTFTLARILGTVPVEPDGSAHFEVPALRSLFLVALDERGLSVKRMQSFLSLQPGETQSCVGCHETRDQAPAATADLLAMRRPPSPIEPIAGVAGRSGPSQFARTGKLQPLAASVPDVLDLATSVQPVLDKHCVRCHNPDRRDGGVDLCGDHTPLFSESYWAMLRHSLIADGRNETYGNRPPRTIGSSASKLLTYFSSDHYDVRPTALEHATVRLWIESSAVYAGTYAALGSGMHPVTMPMDVVERRCGKCHGQKPKGKTFGDGTLAFRFGEPGPYIPFCHDVATMKLIRTSAGYYKFGRSRPPHSLCNLTRPAKSPLLRAPLAKTAGGLGLCKPIVFADTADPDYKAILAAIERASAKHRAEKRFDLPGFVPNVYYTRALQRYGILPADLDPDQPYGFRAAERAYWRSFWHRPAQRAGQ